MGTKAIREALDELAEWRKDHGHDAGITAEALAEVEAIEQAAKDLTRLDVGDFVYAIRDRGTTLRWAEREGRNSWECPDVKAWSDASVLLSTIAKEAK